VEIEAGKPEQNLKKNCRNKEFIFFTHYEQGTAEGLTWTFVSCLWVAAPKAAGSRSICYSLQLPRPLHGVRKVLYVTLANAILATSESREKIR
jgi:hypothetical protein